MGARTRVGGAFGTCRSRAAIVPRRRSPLLPEPPMKYWIDTEFIERPFTIDLISLGLVAEDRREFYAESSEVDWSKASRWTRETVRPQLDGRGMAREQISYAVRRFTDGDHDP